MRTLRKERVRAPEPSSEPALRWWHGWGPLVVLPPAIVLAATAAGWPRWVFMWALAFAIFCGCKWLTWRRTVLREKGLQATPRGRHAGYLLAWPGLDAAAFLSSAVPPRPTRREWMKAAGRLVAGMVLFYGAARLVPWPYAAGWVGMTGLILILHFGSFHLLSCLWRGRGIDARPLMRRPLRSTSLSAFWGRRWNTAFRDLTHRFLFRPLRSRLGARGAIAAGFVFSGFVHEAVISLPAGGGYGGPTLFFAAQSGGLLFERSALGRRIGLGRGGRGWCFTMALLIVPAGLLFHRPFVMRIIVPFMEAVEAL